MDARLRGLVFLEDGSPKREPARFNLYQPRLVAVGSSTSSMQHEQGNEQRDDDSKRKGHEHAQVICLTRRMRKALPPQVGERG